METIVSSLISGLVVLIGAIITNIASNKSTENKIITSLEVLKTDFSNTKSEIETLRKEVEKLSEYATDTSVIKEQIKIINHRIEDLEKTTNSRA